MKQILLVSLVVMLLSGCSKDSSGPAFTDTSKPVITIIAPAKSSYYEVGDPLCFIGDVFDGSTIKQVKLVLYNIQDPAKPILSYNFPGTGRSMYIEQKAFIPATLSGTCILHFEATDYYDNKAVTTMEFSAN